MSDISTLFTDLQTSEVGTLDDLVAYAQKLQRVAHLLNTKYGFEQSSDGWPLQALDEVKQYISACKKWEKHVPVIPSASMKNNANEIISNQRARLKNADVKLLFKPIRVNASYLGITEDETFGFFEQINRLITNNIRFPTQPSQYSTSEQNKLPKLTLLDDNDTDEYENSFRKQILMYLNERGDLRAQIRDGIMPPNIVDDVFTRIVIDMMDNTFPLRQTIKTLIPATSNFKAYINSWIQQGRPIGEDMNKIEDIVQRSLSIFWRLLATEYMSYFVMHEEKT